MKCGAGPFNFFEDVASLSVHLARPLAGEPLLTLSPGGRGVEQLNKTILVRNHVLQIPPLLRQGTIE